MAVKVADFFCGCGGTSQGLKEAGMQIALGLDFDHDAASTFRSNFRSAKFIEKDISEVSVQDVADALNIEPGDQLVFCGCAPCQPFSKINTTKPEVDTRQSLLTKFGTFVKAFRPDYIVVENVPGLQTINPNAGPFKSFLNLLEELGYGGDKCRFEVVECQYYGVPQCRKRLVLIATKHGTEAPWPTKTFGPDGIHRKKLPNVWETIGHLPEIEAGQKHPEIADHQSMNLSKTNLERIQKTPAEKGRETWTDDLVLECHRVHKGHTDVYGRMRKDAPAAALTTKCISLSNGRFGHPVQNRAISVREAALLQKFPKKFRFQGSMVSKARQIGNAVPVALARRIGCAIMQHVRERNEGSESG